MTTNPSSRPLNYSELQAALTPVTRQLERLEERLEIRTQNLVTRSDLEALRREVVARDSLEPQMAALKSQIERVERDRIHDREEWEREIEDLKKEQINRAALLWIRLGPVVAVAAFLLSFFEFLNRIKFIP
jgi:sulfite reductase beta subunit-like hemoprotein